MSRSFQYLDKNFARLEQHKDEKLSSHHGLPVEPTAETSTVVWPEAPPAQRLSLLMQARPSMAGLKAFLKGRAKL
jgi:hypothetical protein